MKVVIAGSRTIEDIEIIKIAIEKSGFNITEVVSGTAKGADTLGEEWAEKNNIPVKKFPADWNNIKKEGAIVKTNKWGKPYDANAGFFRNEQMAIYSDAVIVCMMEDNDTPGSTHMLKMAKKHNKPYFEYIHPKPDSDYKYEF